MAQNCAEAETEARRVVNTWAVAAAGVGWIPGSMLALGALDAKLVGDVAKAYHVQSYSIESVVAAVGASVSGKLAAELLSLVPVFGWLAKSGVAASVTKALGEALIAYMRERSPLCP